MTEWKNKTPEEILRDMNEVFESQKGMKIIVPPTDFIIDGIRYSLNSSGEYDQCEDPDFCDDKNDEEEK